MITKQKIAIANKAVSSLRRRFHGDPQHRSQHGKFPVPRSFLKHRIIIVKHIQKNAYRIWHRVFIDQTMTSDIKPQTENLQAECLHEICTCTHPYIMIIGIRLLICL